MTRPILPFFAIAFVSLSSACGGGDGEAGSERVQLIFDTDSGPDVDDVGAALPADLLP